MGYTWMTSDNIVCDQKQKGSLYLAIYGGMMRAMDESMCWSAALLTLILLSVELEETA